MDKRQIRHNIRWLKRLKTWQLVILLLLAALLCATFLRLNNIGMVERRNAILSADESGDQAAMYNNLAALQRHSAAHMNASSGAFYLEESYKREVERRVIEASRSGTPSAEAVQKADEVCRAQFPGYSQAYVQCNATEQAKFAGTDSLQVAVSPDPHLYRHDFASPLWSPDFAGFTLLLCIVIGLVIIARIIGMIVLRLLLRRHYSSV